MAREWQITVWLAPKEREEPAAQSKYERNKTCWDSASLVDPFSGEGVGNALVTGELAANHIIAGKSPEEYQSEMWKMLGPELTNSYRMQKLSRKKWLLNWFVGKASKKPKIQK